LDIGALYLVILNTSLCSFDRQDAGNLFVVYSDFEREIKNFFNRIKKDEKPYKPTFVIAHHSKGFLAPEQAQRLENILKDNVDLYLCGHSHILGYSYFYTPVDYVDNKGNCSDPIYQINCGCLSSDANDPEFYYGEYDRGKIKITPIRYSRNKKLQMAI
jgi:hypothetical protein